MKEFISAYDEIEAEDSGEEQFVAFMLDDREIHAYNPTDGQLAFMLASMGRGQSSEGRFGSIINIILESLRDEDRDYVEGRMLTRDPKRRLRAKKIEEIFEFLIEEWFGRPTQQPSDSAALPPSDGPK